MGRRYSIKQLLSLIDTKYGLGKLEYLLSINWLNIPLSIYVNLRSFPISQAWKLPLFVYGFPRIYSLSGSMKICSNIIRPGMISFNQVATGAPNTTSIKSELYNEGSIIFHGFGRIGTGCKIRVAFNATLNIGNQFLITDMCNIGRLKKITIGDGTWIVHRCQVLDSNYHYIEDINTHTIPEMSGEISIGKNCWICNSCTITKDAKVPDNIIVASNSLISKDYTCIQPYSMIGGIPAKLLKTGCKWYKYRS